MTFLECTKCDMVDVEEESGPYVGGQCSSPECAGTYRVMGE